MTVTELDGRRPTGPGEHLRADRWQPTRAGILNVWRYYDEVFTFHRGRLLLRGANGTGKSKALELLLPFLLDASLQPTRLSTFGGAERTMHWNLMGDGHTGATRVGYVWLEFGRLDATGQPRWFTCGARLSATAHTRRALADYFTADLRVNVLRVDVPGGLCLVKDGNVPLTRAELVAATEGHGTLHDTPAGYRRVVRETLMRGMSEDQFRALINAQLKLRTPKLSEHLDPEHLSRLLSEALPPLDTQSLAEIAEGFEKLDRRREDLHHLDEELEAASRLADKQRAYARRVLRRYAADLISATTQFDNVARNARESRVAHEEAVASYATMCERLEAIRVGLLDADSRIKGHLDSTDYRQGREIDDLRTQVRSLVKSAGKAQEDAAGRAGEAAQDEQRAADSRQAAQTARGRAGRSYEEATRMAVQSGLGAMFEPLAAVTVDDARRELHGFVSARQQQLTEVRASLAALETAVAERERTDTVLSRRTDELERRALAEQERAREHGETRVALQAALRAWAKAASVLGLAGQAEDLADLADDEPTLLEQVGQAAAQVRESLARDEQRLSSLESALQAERGTLQAERDALAAHAPMHPARPRYRTVDRDTVPGAPLWQLLDWRDDVPEPTRAGVEAALESSGLLDAWIRPDGVVRLVDESGHDSYVAASLSEPAPAANLTAVLVAEPGGPVPANLIGSVLAGIAYGSTAEGHLAAIGADGSWRLGPAHGSFTKPEAAFVGATARERARQRRLAELDALLHGVRARLAELATELARLADRRAVLDTEVQARPPHDALRRAVRNLDQATLRVAEQNDLVREATQEHAAAEEQARQRLRTLALVASRHALPTTRQALEELGTLLHTFRTTADGWLTERERWLTADSRAADASAQAERTRAIAQDAAESAAVEQEKADILAARLAAVEEAVGAPYQRVLDLVEQLRRMSESLRREERDLLPRKDEINRRIGELAKGAQVADERRQTAVETRDHAAEALMHLGRLGFGRDGHVKQDLTALTTATAALEAARTLATELERLAYEQTHIRKAEADLSETMHGVSQYLAGHVDLAMEPDPRHDVQLVMATIDGQRIGPTDLVARLRDERDGVRSQLTDDERTLFDRTLTGDTRRHVADRIRQADELIRDISAQLEQVRTVSDLRVRLVWQVDPELGPVQRQARDLLLRDPATLVESQRETLHDFFRSRIEAIRQVGTTGGWQQQLEEVLDYRNWHRFTVQMRQPGGEWVTVTRRQHGAKSGGEKAIVLHLPLFAAAAAHYRAAPEGPRLILLDEVFVGVDSTNRGQLMEVLAAFDLDLMLTSDTEWCTYAELDGIAIHQLLTGDDGDDAVTTARFVWNGHVLRPADPLDV